MSDAESYARTNIDPTVITRSLSPFFAAELERAVARWSRRFPEAEVRRVFAIFYDARARPDDDQVLAGEAEPVYLFAARKAHDYAERVCAVVARDHGPLGTTAYMALTVLRGRQEPKPLKVAWKGGTGGKERGHP